MLYNDKYHWLLIEDYALQSSVGEQQQQPGLHLTDTDASADELEQPIEHLMETLNFYMNTELTLAKRSSQAEARYTLYDVWYVQGEPLGWETGRMVVNPYAATGSHSSTRIDLLPVTVSARCIRIHLYETRESKNLLARNC